MADLKAIAEELVNLTVKEVNELATILKDEYGIEPAAAAVAVAAGPAAGGAASRSTYYNSRVISGDAFLFFGNGMTTVAATSLPRSSHTPEYGIYL